MQPRNVLCVDPLNASNQRAAWKEPPLRKRLIRGSVALDCYHADGKN
jgi:hypothetical protein